MTFEEKLTLASKEMHDSGILKSGSTPPLLVMYHKLGIKVRPPQYSSFIANMLKTGIFYGLFWGTAMWFFLWRADGMPVFLAALTSIFAGATFGSFMAFFYRRSAAKHGLSSWDELGQDSRNSNPEH